MTKPDSGYVETYQLPTTRSMSGCGRVVNTYSGSQVAADLALQHVAVAVSRSRYGSWRVCCTGPASSRIGEDKRLAAEPDVDQVAAVDAGHRHRQRRWVCAGSVPLVFIQTTRPPRRSTPKPNCDSTYPIRPLCS